MDRSPLYAAEKHSDCILFKDCIPRNTLWYSEAKSLRRTEKPETNEVLPAMHLSVHERGWERAQTPVLQLQAVEVLETKGGLLRVQLMLDCFDGLAEHQQARQSIA
jgi:hypothetical protein